MMGPLMQRAAKLSDLDRLEQLWLHAVANSHPSLPRQFWLDRIGLFRTDCSNAKRCRVFTGRHSAVAEAFITVTGDDRIAYLCVSPLFSGCGIATNLLTEATRDIPKLQAQVLRENLRTRYFLQRQGFKEQERDYRAEFGQHLILMGCG
ncbi:hypothetical protein MO867_11160 [Microbulbifer sp. OS29]|uniref:N-acetyltransferase domain-containing protein n=1 Tax=Microbulbifer okhotskensis TaxID=2926617 RepID=A0A9X2ENG2_9GAMM|nr:hypothetical protein [Microbulbifer okhotskensis]MCO1334899.1 hypothetical protein [Microbulbifer okhotskensis]